MVKVKDINFNIFTFILKTTLVILSIAVSIALLMFFEQNGMAIRSVLLRNETGSPVNVMRFNEKEVERILYSLIPSFVITKTIIFNVCKFISFVYVGLTALVCFILSVILKTTDKNFKTYSVSQNEKVAFKNESNNFNVYTKQNAKLTI